MPLGVRDVMLIMRARDEASRIVNDASRMWGILGGQVDSTAKKLTGAGLAMTATGAIFTAAGTAALSFFKDATDAAVDYNQQAALTLTQIDGLGTSLEEIKDIGRRVADAIPAPFEQMQASLFDIFSSMDVNVTQAEILLREFARGAVAGQTDIQTAGRATIAIMNAWRIPAEQVSHVMDVQFQLVRKGVGTYEEFATSIGRVIPSANRAGQSVETMAGMLAFLTRNGLSADMAATSAARALDAMSHPQTTKRIEAMGIATRDATGEFRPLTDVLRDLNEKFSKMTAPERAAALQELFKASGGTIQARRFFDLVFKNFDEFEQRVGEMQDSAGAMDEAYNIMFEQPQSQMQLLDNKWQTLKTTIGDTFLPILTTLVEKGQELLDWFKNLDPQTQQMIIKIAALAAVFSVVLGVVLLVVGVFLMIAGAAAAAGIALSTVGVVIAVVLVVIAALVAAGILIYKNWDTIKAKAEEVWGAIQKYWEDFQVGLDQIREKASEVWNDILEWWNNVVTSITESQWWNTLVETFGTIRDTVVDIFNTIKNWWDENDIWGDIVDTAMNVRDSLAEIWGEIQETFTTVWEAIQAGWNLLYPVIEFVLNIITSAVQGFVEFFQLMWQTFGDDIMNIWSGVWNAIMTVVNFAIDFVKNLIGMVLNIIQGDWEGVWNNILGFLSATWEGIKGIVGAALDILKGIIGGALEILGSIWDTAWNAIKEAVSKVWEGIKSAAETGVNAVVDVVSGIKDKILGFFSGAKDWLFDIGGDIIGGLKDGIMGALGPLGDALGGIGGFIQDHKGPPEYDAQILVGNGQLIMQGLQRGMQQEWKRVENWLETVAPEINSTVSAGITGNGIASTGPVVPPQASSGTAISIAEGAVVIRIEGNPDQAVIETVRNELSDALEEIVSGWAGKPTWRG